MTGDEQSNGVQPPIDPIEQNPSFPRDYAREWTIAQGPRRSLSCGVLDAIRRSVQERLTAIREHRVPGTDALVSNLTAALNALGGCENGEFVPLYPVDVLTTSEWDALRDDLKDGDPAQGTARYARASGGQMVRCLVVANDKD